MDTFATREHVKGQRLTGLAGRGIDRSVSVKSGLTKRHGVSAGYRDRGDQQRIERPIGAESG
jgi:hypothetical protein